MRPWGLGLGAQYTTLARDRWWAEPTLRGSGGRAIAGALGLSGFGELGIRW